MTEEYIKKLEQENAQMITKMEASEDELKYWKKEISKFIMDNKDLKRINENYRETCNHQLEENVALRNQWDKFVNSEVALRMSEPPKAFICQIPT